MTLELVNSWSSSPLHSDGMERKVVSFTSWERHLKYVLVIRQIKRPVDCEADGFFFFFLHLD